MEGRWTIIVNHSDEVIGDSRWEMAARDDLSVPVVPCDDAAIGRARRDLNELEGRVFEAALAGSATARDQIAECVLRAAGETS